MPNALPSNMPFTRPAFVDQDKVTAEKFKTQDSKGHTLEMMFASAQYLPENHTQCPRFDIHTRSMLVVPNPDGRYQRIWEANIYSEIDNTNGLEPVSDHLYSGYRITSKTFHPMKPEFQKQMEQKAYRHHDRHKTDVVMSMAGISPSQFIDYLK